CMKNG
ncbi:hypothetical protein D046_2046B, partial [Vibrio parahaemolyticus V-223/04]